MKALILAAGLGTRLLPHTKHTPKPLFPIDGRPLLDHVIRSLIKADCRGIVVNTHHLHGQIEAFLKGQRYPVPVTTRYEPDILGTGGAMKNLADFFSGKPFMVINSDIVTDIHLKDVYVFHCRHQDAATLVLHDCPTFNSVSLNSHGCITGFGVRSLHAEHASGTLAFTGIQVLDPSILAHIPAGCFYSSIDLYRQLIQRGEKVRAYFAENHHWRDIGTPEQYREAVYRETVPDAFRAAFPGLAVDDIHRQKLMGDGSDRLWFRLTSGDKTLVMADHGIRENRSTAEVDSFVDIGRFLFEKKLPVPEIHLYHRFSGLVFLEDLGDVHLQAYLKGVHHPEGVISVYETIIEQLAAMWTSGSEGFNPSWTYQSPRYDRGLILERECHYFLRAFINNYMEIPYDVEVLNPEFNTLADGLCIGTCNPETSW